MSCKVSAHLALDRKEEFIELLTRHKHELYNLIFCILRNSADTEDVFQQTSLAIWERFDCFEPGSNFRAWSSQIARYRISQFIRSRRRNQLYFSDGLIEQLAECPLESYEMHESRLAALAVCKQKLSSTDQQLITLCYGGRGSIQDVAMEIGRPVQAVYNSLSRIRNSLYECIKRRLAREGHV